MGRTVRLRFTILYAVLFLVSAIGLLVLTNLFASVNSSQPAPGQPPPAQEYIRQLEDIEAMQSRQLLVGSLIALVVMAIVSVALGNAVAGRVLRPLRTVTAATRRISAENLHERLAVPGPADEVKDLADTIDGLLERLEASFTAQRRFVANTSHELRTPLTTMRASLDVAVAKPQPPPQTVALADRLRTELDRVDRLLEGLLALARAQHGALTERAPIALTALVSEAVATRAAAIADKNVTLDDAGLQDTVWIRGSPTLLSCAVENIIDNAILHNEDDGWIRVATTTGHATAQLVVETGGPVLDQDQVDRLAQPFQRLVADRTGSETGSGLGLSIVAAIADAHGGRLDLHARPDGGLRVTISLPPGDTA
jgi:signal transduction histidine kinase